MDELVFLAAFDPVALLDAELIVRRANPAWETSFGHDPAALLGHPLTQLVHTDDQRAVRQLVEAAGRAGPDPGREPDDLDLRLRDGDGRKREVQVRARAAAGEQLLVVVRDLTEQRRSARLLEHLEETTGIGTFELDLDHDRVHWSAAVHAIYGSDPADGEPDLDRALACYPPRARAVLEPAVAALVTDGTGYDLETPFIDLTGRERWVRGRARAVTRDGRVVAASGTFEDVTERRERERDLARFKRMVELGRDGVWEIDPCGVTVYANARMAELLETTVAAMLGRPVTDWVDAVHQAAAEERIAEVATGTADSFEFPLRTARGARRWLNISGRPRRDNDGRVVALLAMCSDLTELKRQQELVRASEQQLRTFVELAPLAITQHDAVTGQVTAVNRAATRLAGLPREALLGATYRDLLALDPQLDAALSGEVDGAGRFGPVELAVPRPDGERREAEAVGIRLHAPDGRAVVWTLLQDVTERRRLERMKDGFVATVSHEVRTPLTAISGALELLTARQSLPAPDRARLLEVAARNAARLRVLVEDVLDLSRLADGDLPVVRGPVRLLDVVQDAVEVVATPAEQAGVELRVAPARVGSVVGDADLLRQAVVNLLANAVRYAPRGTVVEAALHEDAAGVEVVVRDHGPGVPPGFVDQMFERFTQADSSDRRQPGGTGLGLSIVRSIAELHAGSVRYEPPEDGGARFVLRLPSQA